MRKTFLTTPTTIIFILAQMNLSCCALLVDDDEDDQFFFTEAVNSISQHISCNLATNGLVGLQQLCEGQKPDIIFLDLNMPGMNGFEFLKLLRTKQEFICTPVVIYTTSARLQDIEQARASGAQAYLTKPTDLKSLELKLRIAFELDYSKLTSLYIIA